MMTLLLTCLLTAEPTLTPVEPELNPAALSSQSDEDPVIAARVHQRRVTKYSLMISGFGTAVAGLAIGAVTGLDYVFSTNCYYNPGLFCIGGRSDPSSSGPQTLRIVSDVALVAGAVGLVVGLASLAIDTSPPPSSKGVTLVPWLSSKDGGVALAGRF